jgi:hypothetical protein
LEASESPGVAVSEGAVVVVEDEGFLGYCRRATAPAADRTGLETDEPMSRYARDTIVAWSLQLLRYCAVIIRS